MARLTQHDLDVRRSGVVLLIVLAMLALFAVVGLSFVFYSQSEADGARWRRAIESSDLSDVMPEKLMSYAMGQLIFGPDPTKNSASKMYGFNLAKSIYGPVGGTTPFNGLGLPHPDTRSLTQIQSDFLTTPFDGINVPYTFPDNNNAFLATIDENGVFQERSFIRNKASLRPTSLPPMNPGDLEEGDVRNVDSLAGVKGKNGQVLFNDAFWMDLNFPILTAKDGTRYKPLFAFTILDLDSRINLGVVGNYLANYNNPDGTSSCGLGAFEINPARVLQINKGEIATLFRGSATAPSRYGPGGTDAPDTTVTFPTTKFYSRVDYSGTSAGRPTQPAVNYSQFPTFGGWADLPAGTQHAAGYDYHNSRLPSPTNPGADTRFAPSNAEAILRWRDRGSASLTSDLMRLLPQNLDPRTTGSSQTFHLLTPYSMSLDVAHLAPFLVQDGNAKYQLIPAAPVPGATTGVMPPFPTSTVVTQTIPGVGGVSELSTDFRSRTAAELKRINLNRGISNMADRQTMAREIFERLVRVTGAQAPSSVGSFVPTDPQYEATRWLAQYAVNIVDFIDDDDIMTVFNWNPRATPKAEDYVIGVELNRLLINEAYVSFDNDKSDPGLANLKLPDATHYRVNAWAELHNPMRNDASLRNNGAAGLMSGGFPGYRLLLAKDATGISTHPTGQPTNLLYANTQDPTLGVDDWPANSLVPGGDQSAAGTSFFLVGPPDTFLAARKPTWGGINWNHTSPGMHSELQNFPGIMANYKTFNPTLALQRLADPTRPENKNPADTANYNPFITVDYYENIQANDSVEFIGAQDRMPSKIGTFHSFGRQQPLQGEKTTVKPQSPNPPHDKNQNEPQHTFSRQNSRSPNAVNSGDPMETLKTPFAALYHLDRPLISTAEVLHAPAVAPWMVTQKHPNNSFSAYPAMKAENSLLYRFLETVTVGDRMYNKYLSVPPYNTTGKAGEGRPAIFIPGRINLNTISSKKVLEALFDRHSNSYFSDADVDAFWTDLQAVRANGPIAGFSDFTLDRSTQKATIKETLFKDNTLFDKMFRNSTGQNEYEKTEGLRKVMNNITFTSNTFAVWVTVGFFEVDGTGNVTQEIGKTEGRHVRHRMFSIVDRTNLVLPDQQLTILAGGGTKGSQNATLAAAQGTLTVPSNSSVKVEYTNWRLKPGMALTFDKDLPNEETVQIITVKGNQITVGGFLHDHQAPKSTVHFGGIRGPQVPLNNGTNNFVLGNPGPQPNFNLREYTYVVPYYSIID